MSERDQLLDDVCRAPEDWKLRGVLADWLEDNNRLEEAACLRWMVKNKKRPYHGSSSSATWFNADRIGPGLGDVESDVPEEVYLLLEGGQTIAHHQTFADARAAEGAFVAAWVAAARAGWKPDAAKAAKSKVRRKKGATSAPAEEPPPPAAAAPKPRRKKGK